VTRIVDAVAVESKVQEAIIGILGASVAANEPLMAAGLDSLGTMELRNTLEASLGTQLPGTMVFDYPTVDSMVQFLTTHLGGVSSATAVGAGMFVTHAASVYGAPSETAVFVGAMSQRSPGNVLSRLGMPRGGDAVGLVPLERWDIEIDPLAARFGAYIPDITTFDAKAFGISDNEAILMDPQQRLLLEVVGESLLGAPQSVDAPHAARGIFVGEFFFSLLLLNKRHVDSFPKNNWFTHVPIQQKDSISNTC